MTKNNLLTKLKKSVQEFNKWRIDSPFEAPLDLSGFDLTGMDFTHANLSGINLSGVNLSEVSLGGADLLGTNLTGANLSKAILWEARFENTVLDCTNLDGSNFGQTVINKVDLSGAIGLSNTIHLRPSTIGIETLYLSKGKIPEEFLRGCGVPEDFIRYIPSLVGAEQVIQFYSCYISYSTKDEEFAYRLHSRMRDAKLRVWFAPEDMKGGKKIFDQIETAIQMYDRLLLVLSDSSIQSEWVFTEIRRALKAEKRENRRKLFPIRLSKFERIKDWELIDADTGKDLAVEIRSYFIPDFSNWKDHDAFEAAFARLLKDLRAEEKMAK